MSAVRPQRTEDVRVANRRRVYDALARLGDATRADLAAATQLSVPTVSAIVDDFEGLRLVAEGGRTASRGGRPARTVRFEPRAALAIGVDLSGDHARAVVVDLRGELGDGEIGPPLGPGAEREIAAWLGGLVDERRADASALRVAVAVPGVVAPDGGRVRLAPHLGWDDHDLRGGLEASLGVPVLLENDVNALAIAEHHYGRGREHAHLLYVALHRGLGASLVLNGRLHRGAHAAAGEIGYGLLPGLPGPADPDGLVGPGPLERHLAALVEAFGRDGRLDLGRTGAREAYDAFLESLGAVLHNAVCLLDPEVVLVDWPLDPGGRLVRDLGARWRGPFGVAFRTSELGALAACRGVARLALRDLEDAACRLAWEAVGA